MRGRSEFTILLLMLATSFAASPIKTAAQCFGGLPFLGQVSGMTGNPFQAEVKQTFLTQNTSLVQNLEPRTQQVARDSQGRLRTDFSAGKYKVQNGPAAGTEQEQHHITICDPVKGEWISLDTLNKTATIQKVNLRATPPKALQTTDLPSFCSRQLRLGVSFPGSQTEDLGHRTIEGMDAQGVLSRQTMQNGFTSGTTTSVQETTSETESWCSEELGAVILRVIGTEKKGNTQTISMVNIQRGEPDATLFEIPPDYRIAERMNNPAVRTGVGIIGSMGVGSSAGQTTVPDKP
jgi:hypothetical protein